MTSTCGEYRGYQAHRRRGEQPCAACRRANSAYMAAWRERQAEMQARNAEAQLARNRALRRLAKQFPGEFRALYGEEAAS